MKNQSMMRRMRIGRLSILLMTMMLLLTGCGGSAKDRLYEAFKCAKVATLLGEERMADNAMNSVLPYAKELELEAGGEHPGFLMMEMNQLFQDDVPLHRITPDSQVRLINKIYRSSKCQALYKTAQQSG